MRLNIKKSLEIAGAGLIMLFSTQGYTSGYRLEFQSASTLADAGEAAVVEDAGTNWYNAAGLVYLPQQYVFSLINLYVPSVFSGRSNAPSTIAPGSGFDYNVNGKASSHANIQLPAIHYNHPFLDRWSFGLSLVPAWGLLEDYGETSIVRYDLTRIYTKTINIAPSIAYRYNDQWSFAAGPDFHYMSVISKSRVNTAPATQNDSISRFSANNWGYGAHIGILYRYDDATRVGLNYRTKIVMDLSGYSDFQLTGIASFEENNFKLKIPLPPTTILSVYRDINSRWAMMGTIAYDQWSVLKQYHAQNVVTPSGVTPSLVLPQNMQNTIDLSIGTRYRLNDKWLLRGSLKYEPTPTINSFRDINFPDGRKFGFILGSRYQASQKIAFDMIFGNTWFKTVGINGLNKLTNATVTGQQRTSSKYLGAQIVWNI